MKITGRRLVNITGGMTDGLYFVGSVAHFQCEAGYMSSDGPSICQANGTWSPMYTCIGNDVSFHRDEIFCILNTDYQWLIHNTENMAFFQT